MTDFFWPGDHRAAELFSEETFLEALTAVEVAWLDTLVETGVAPIDAKADLEGIVEPFHDEWLVEEAEAGANPVIGTYFDKDVFSLSIHILWLVSSLSKLSLL